MIPGKAKMLVIFVDEADLQDKTPLYELIVRKLVKLGVDGATIQAGMLGFGNHHGFHRTHLFDNVPGNDRPITIMVADSEEKLRKVIPEIKPMLKEGLMIMIDAEIL